MRIRTILWAGLAAAGLAVGLGDEPAGAEFYSWRDAEGRLHFGDRPPPGAQDLQLRESAVAAETEAGLEATATEPETAEAEVQEPRQPLAHDAFVWEDPEGKFTLSFPKGWAQFPQDVLEREWASAAPGGRRFTAGFYYDTDPSFYTCPCALVTPVAEDTAQGLVSSAYEEAALARATGPDRLPEQDPSAPQVLYDRERDVYWFRMAVPGPEGTPRSVLSLAQRLDAGAVQLLIMHDAASFDLYAPVIQEVARGLAVTPSGAPQRGYDKLRTPLIAMGVLSLVFGAWGFRRSGVKTGLAYLVAIPVSAAVLVLAAASEGAGLAKLDPSIALPHLIGYAFGLQALAVLVVLARAKTRNLDSVVRTFVGVSMLVLVVLGVDAVRVTTQNVRENLAAQETGAETTGAEPGPIQAPRRDGAPAQ